MPSEKKSPLLKTIFGATVLCLILGTVLLYYGPSYIERRLNRLEIETIFERSTGGSFTSGNLRFKLFPLPHVIIPDARITIPGKLEGKWQTLHVYPSFSALFLGNLRVEEIVIEKPDFAASVSATGNTLFSPSHLTGEIGTIIPVLPDSIPQPVDHLRDARIEVRDGKMRIDGFFQHPVQIDGLDLDLQLPPEGAAMDLQCHSNIWESLNLKGNLQPDTLQGQLQLNIVRFDPEILNRLLPASPIQWESSIMDVKATATISDNKHAAIDIQSRIPRIQLVNGPQSVSVEEILLKGTLNYTPDRYQFDLMKLQAERPSLALSGQVDIRPDTPSFQVDLMGRDVKIDPLRKAAMTIAGDNEVVAGIFDVLRGGNVSWIRFDTKGKRPEEMGVFRNMTIAGVVEGGQLFIPGAGLALTDVHGEAHISKGVLKGSDLTAAYGETKGSNGRLWLDLDKDDDVPFFLDINVDADLAPLPALLGNWVEDPVFQGEMQRIRNMNGKAEGTLVLDGRGSQLDVTVDVARCRFDVDYARLPSKLSISEGMVQYTRDRIQVIQMNGRLGTSRFNDLTAHVTYGDSPLIQVDNASAHIDLDQIIPWMGTYGLFQSWPFSLQPRNSQLKIDRLQMEGPVLQPDQWTFSTRGSLKSLTITGQDLPGPANIKKARFVADNGKVEIPEAHIQMADGDISLQQTQILLEAYSPKAASLVFSGVFGEKAGAWIGERIDLGKPWRLKTPVTVSKAAVGWSPDGEKTVAGDMKTGGGTLVSLEVKLEDEQLRHQKLVIKDKESQAELQVDRGPESLDIVFNGRISAATINRMMEEKRPVSGHMEGQFQAHIDPKHPGQSSVAGTLTARDIHQPLRIATAFNIDELHLEAIDNRLFLKPAVVEVDNQTHRITGSIDIEDTGYVLDLKHTATHFSLNLPESPSPDGDDLSLWELPLRGRVISRFDSFALGKFQWSPFSATVNISKNRWDCHIEKAKLCGIETKGNVLITPHTLSIALTPETHEENLNDSMTCLLEKPNLIDGDFDLDGSLASTGRADQLGRSVQGQVGFNARKGRIYRFNLLSKTLAVVNLTEIFRGKIPNLMEGGLAYDRIDIQVSIENSVCTIEQAILDGPSVHMAGQGKVDLVTGETDMTILVAPFKTVDAIVKYTPIIGDWLGGTLVSIPVRVSGTFSDPEVTPLSPKAVGNSLMNLMKRTVNLPVKIVEPLLKGNE